MKNTTLLLFINMMLTSCLFLFAPTSSILGRTSLLLEIGAEDRLHLGGHTARSARGVAECSIPLFVGVTELQQIHMASVS